MLSEGGPTCLVGVSCEGGGQDLPSLSIPVVALILVFLGGGGGADLALHQSLRSSLVGLSDLLELGLDRLPCECAKKREGYRRPSELRLTLMTSFWDLHHRVAAQEAIRSSFSVLALQPPASPSPSAGDVTFHPEHPDPGHAPCPAVARPAPWQPPPRLCTTMIKSNFSSSCGL